MDMTAGTSTDFAQADALAALLGELEALCREGGRADIAARCRSLAGVVGELGMEPEIVRAAAIYPALYAGLLDLDEIRRRYSDGAADLCADLSQLHEMSPEPAGATDPVGPGQAEGLRRMLLAAVKDVRLVVVRLADVLLALREAKRQPAEIQQAMAVQCRDIYAPLANRLGIWQLKWELEDLSFRMLEPETYRRIARQL
ncbi:MAG: HD domain-containing protein, partial [Gammaproteobacteria bacterium]